MALFRRGYQFNSQLECIHNGDWVFHRVYGFVQIDYFHGLASGSSLFGGCSVMAETVEEEWDVCVAECYSTRPYNQLWKAVQKINMLWKLGEWRIKRTATYNKWMIMTVMALANKRTREIALKPPRA